MSAFLWRLTPFVVAVGGSITVIAALSVFAKIAWIVARWAWRLV